MKLVLFDIDGTLLGADGAGRRALKRVMDDYYQPLEELANWSFGGKTDPQIARELLSAIEFEIQQLESEIPVFVERYLTYFKNDRANIQAQLKPGILELLQHLEGHPEVELGLLTGNVVEGAQIKLEILEIEHYFKDAPGAYGSDHEDRYQLVPFALERSKQHYREKDIVIIGDTPHDIQCGLAWNVRSIAVATGAFTVQELEAYEPDYVFEDLSSTQTVLDAILAK
jgi:phosphoglycolate phosphatase